MAKKTVRFDSNNSERQNRFDIISNSLSQVRITSQGFLRIPAALTRVGVLEYTRADGTTVRELRHPDEVFAESSLDSLRAAPVTNDHSGMITPENVNSHSIGIVSETIRHDIVLVKGEIIVQRQDAIKDVQSGALKELSPGYTCQIDPTPGTFNGERYDQKQTDIIYNHVALGPVGWGRSGPEVALRMDGAGWSSTEIKETNVPNVGDEEILSMKKIRITLDGMTFEVEVAEGLAPTLEASIEKLNRERVDSKDALAKAEGAKDAAEKESVNLKARLDAATAPEALEALVSERTAVIEKARMLSPEAKFDGLSIDEIRKLALENQGFKRETLDSQASAYIEGVFEAIKVEKAEADTVVLGVSLKPPEQRADGIGRTASDARAEMLKRNQDAYKTLN